MDKLFEQFTSLYTVDDIKMAAEEQAYLVGSPLTIYQDDIHCGIAGVVIAHKLRLLGADSADIPQLVKRLLVHYNIQKDWVPPVALMREALALTVQLKVVLVKLGESVNRRELVNAGTIVKLFDSKYQSPIGVFSLSYQDMVDELSRLRLFD